MARPISKTTKFILSQPHTLTAREVLTNAKAIGLKTSESNVHRVRRLHRANGSTSAKGKAPQARASVRPAAPPRGAAVTVNNSHSSSAEALLRAVAAEIGLGRALELLANERAKVRAVMGG